MSRNINYGSNQISRNINYAGFNEGINTTINVISWKKPARAATTANITLSNTQTVDGIVLVADDRCLVKDQTSAPENGLYLVKATAWQRTEDMDESKEFPAATIHVNEGTVNADIVFTCTNDPVVVIGTTSITFNSGLSMTTITLSALTASRIVQTNGSKTLASVTDLTTWVAGTTDQISVVDDSDGTITLSTPQSIATTSNVTFGDVITNDILPASTKVIKFPNEDLDVKIYLKDTTHTIGVAVSDSNMCFIVPAGESFEFQDDGSIVELNSTGITFGNGNSVIHSGNNFQLNCFSTAYDHQFLYNTTLYGHMEIVSSTGWKIESKKNTLDLDAITTINLQVADIDKFVVTATNCSVPTGSTLTVVDLTTIPYANSGVLSDITVGSSLLFSAPTLNVIQDIRTSASPTFVSNTLSGLTANTIVYGNGSKLLSSVTLSSNITLTTGTLDVIQDIQTSSSPTFAGGTLTGFTSILYANTGVITDVTVGASLSFSGGVLNVNATKMITAEIESTSNITIDANSAGSSIITLTNEGAGATNVIMDAAQVSNLTASRMVSTDGSKNLQSQDMTAFIAGTTDQISVVDDSDGTVTLSTPQSINTTSSPTFANLTTSTQVNTPKIANTAGITLDMVNASTVVLAIVNSGAGSGSVSIDGNISVDNIEEFTAAGGVTIDDLTTIKDGTLTTGIINTDTIVEKTSSNGVHIEGIHFEDNNIFEGTTVLPSNDNGINLESADTTTDVWHSRIAVGDADVKVIMGVFDSSGTSFAIIAGHNAALSAWDNLYLGPTAFTGLATIKSPQIRGQALTSNLLDVVVDDSNSIGYDNTSLAICKLNVSDLTDVSFLYTIPVKKYNFKNQDSQGNFLDTANTDELHTGIIAEDLHAINTEICCYSDIKHKTLGNLIGFRSKSLIAPMLKALQQQKLQITALENRCNVLEGYHS